MHECWLLTGHDAASRLILGQGQLSQATPRSRGKESQIIGNFHDGARHSVEGPGHLNHGVVGGESLEFVRSCDEGKSGDLGDVVGDRLGESNSGVEACANSSSACGQHVEAGKSRLNALDA